MTRAQRHTVSVILIILGTAITAIAAADNASALLDELLNTDASSEAQAPAPPRGFTGPGLIMLEDLPPAERAYYEQRFREGPRPGDAPQQSAEPAPLEVRPAERMSSSAATIRSEIPEGAEEDFSGLARAVKDSVAAPDAAGAPDADAAPSESAADGMAPGGETFQSAKNDSESSTDVVDEVLKALSPADNKSGGSNVAAPRRNLDDLAGPGLSGRAFSLNGRKPTDASASPPAPAIAEQPLQDRSTPSAEIEMGDEASQGPIAFSRGRASLEIETGEVSPSPVTDEPVQAVAAVEVTAEQEPAISKDPLAGASLQSRSSDEQARIDAIAAAALESVSATKTPDVVEAPLASRHSPSLTLEREQDITPHASGHTRAALVKGPPEEYDLSVVDEASAGTVVLAESTVGGAAVFRKGGSAADAAPAPEPAVAPSPPSAGVTLAAAQRVVEQRLSSAAASAAAATAGAVALDPADARAGMEIGAARDFAPSADAEPIISDLPRTGTIQQKLRTKTVEICSARDAELEAVIRLIAVQHGLNILANREVYGGKRVSFHFEDIRLGVLLENLLRIHSLGYVADDENNLIRVVPASELGIDEIERRTEAIEIKWVKAATLVETLKSFVTGGGRDGGSGGGGTSGSRDVGRIIANEETNTIILTDTPPQIEIIKGLIATLDVASRQVQIEARLVDMLYDASRQLGMQWDMWRRDAHQNAPGPYGANWTGRGTYPVRVPSGGTDNGGGDNGGGDNGGSDNGGGGDPLGSAVAGAIGTVAAATQYTQETGPIDVLSYGASGGSFTFGDVISILGRDFNIAAVLTAYEQKGLVETLANPRVTTLNNLEASIDIADQFPYKDSVQNQGGQETDQWQYQDIGVKITVTPNITPNGFVRLDVKTVQTILSGQPPEQSGRPPVAKREATTNVIVRDRETAMLGGLRQQFSTEIRSGVPWLHEIPLLGWLFKNKGNTSSKSELYLFITPSIIEEISLTPDQAAWYERIDTQWHLPDYFFDDVKTMYDK